MKTTVIAKSSCSKIGSLFPLRGSSKAKRIDDIIIIRIINTTTYDLLMNLNINLRNFDE